MEDAGYAKALVAGREAERRQLTLGAGDKNAVAHLRADGIGKVFTEHDRRIGCIDRGLAGKRLCILIGCLRFEVFG